MRVELAILAYNEARNFPAVVNDVAAAFRALPGVELRIVIVDNGSSDDTPAVIQGLKEKFPEVDSVCVPQNLGYGYGIKQGLAALRGDIVGYMWGDNQFAAGITADLAKSFLNDEQIQMAKTYRTKRHDGRRRLYVSAFYQSIFRLLYGSFTRDINSGPKLFRADFLREIMPFESNDWFIDAEIMIKVSRRVGKDKLAELPVEFHQRKFGKSNVKLADCFYFLFNLFWYKIKHH